MRDVAIETADQVLHLATSDPERTVEVAELFLREKPNLSSKDRAILHRAMGVAHQLLGRFEDAIEFASRARAIAVDAGDGEEQLLAIVTMVGPMVVVGRADEALALVDGATDLATTPYLMARLSYQRGVVWGMKGESVRAIEAFESSLPAFQEAGDSEMIGRAMRALGHQRLATGDLLGARQALENALSVALDRNEEPIISGLKHNLGLLASYRGDITEALRLLVESDEIYMRLTGSAAPQHVARCEVLLSAGLFREAERLASEIATQHRLSGDPEHLADALLVAARAALYAGDLEKAHTTAEEAARLNEDKQRQAHALDARRIVIESRYGLEGASAELLGAAGEVAASLELGQRMLPATQARLLAGQIAIDLGDLDQATEWLEPVSRLESGPVELKIQSRLATARLRLVRGETQGADAAVRSGLRLIDDYQAALGATDLRMGLERHGAELGSIGLGLALESGAPRRILGWMDRTRARSLRRRPVSPERDEEVVEALARLRQVEAELRDPAKRGDSRFERERRRLQERIRAIDRLKRADAVPDDGAIDVDGLIAAVGDRSLLEIATYEGRLVGVVVSGGRARRLELGDSDKALRELGHVRFAMRRAARRSRSIGAEVLTGLDRILFADHRLDSDEVILVPPPSLMATPWSAMPTLRGSTVTISPSAEMWWRSQHRNGPGQDVVVAGGPDLAVAESEVREVARLYGDAKVLVPGSTVDDVRNAIDSVSIAHIACHATFQSENPMFSSLRLGDGDLNVYDIERLNAPPSTVVLSACDSGYTEAMAGIELAGLTSALLSMGSRSVVASVGLVPDSPATSDLMLRFHRGLIEGLTPARALSAAQEASLDDPAAFIAAASFICVGA